MTPRLACVCLNRVGNNVFLHVPWIEPTARGRIRVNVGNVYDGLETGLTGMVHIRSVAYVELLHYGICLPGHATRRDNEVAELRCSTPAEAVEILARSITAVRHWVGQPIHLWQVASRLEVGTLGEVIPQIDGWWVC